ncbi:MAG: cyclic nucleotide-binding domain-containing protein [Hyphomicrobiaceae bacterium]
MNAVVRTGHLGEEASWYISSTRGLEPWLPFNAIQSSDIHWFVYLSSLPELATCVFVGLISLIVRISSLEASRLAAANINHELRIYGGASLLAGISGAMTGGILFSTSKFMVASGARTRFAYVVVAALLGLTMFANISLSSMVPTSILGGLLLLLGCSMTAEALRVTFTQRAIKEIVLAIAIMLLCLKFGFIVGVLAGFVAACLMFAYSYARIGVVRRYSTRAELAGGTERSHDAEMLIRNNGESIQVYELAGYVFFGSSESLFDQIRTMARRQDDPAVRIVILDFARVTGYDSSAVNTLNKLRGHCRRHGILLCLSGLDSHFQQIYASTEMPSLTADTRFFDGLIEALDWSEECLLAALQQPRPKTVSIADFADWLSKELGTEFSDDLASLYFDRIDVEAGQQLYTQGEAANTIDFVASGTVAMMSYSGSEERRTCVRRSSRQTVLGEMGFFRGSSRNVSIVAERSTTIFSLTRANFEKLKENNPEIHYGLLNFVIRTLADRLEMATTELSSIR